MNNQPKPPNKSDGERKDRLAEALRANLQKRKAQVRSRRAGDADKGHSGDADRQRVGDADKQHAGDRPEGPSPAEKMQKD
ncbi:hypothetical protein [Mesorhizobium sp. ORS 3428]|uniref:hypothetical protein n=1 Tax=Mesorhizobium sp. ORS 3428 TaxID=540997 RepID=UPI0008D92756|nr:hypothetical protein [Mesorhizobium sp. ORS 3428]OHV86133.1 hypothetical protein ORS3428_25820 [Mesorhizobium sp. ORS 3428]